MAWIELATAFVGESYAGRTLMPPPDVGSGRRTPEEAWTVLFRDLLSEVPRLDEFFRRYVPNPTDVADDNMVSTVL